MKREYAIQLESYIEGIVALLFECSSRDVEVSLSLSNMLKIYIKDIVNMTFWFDRNTLQLICFDNDNYSQIYLSSLEEYKNNLEKLLQADQNKINELLWSYDNRRELED